MTLLKDNNYKEINIALLSLEADINKLSNNGSFDTSVIDRQLAEINSRIDKINAGGNSSAAINYIRTEIEDINSKLNVDSAKIEKIEQKLSDIFSAENKVTDFNTTTDSGIYYWTADAANRPTDYGVLLVNKLDGGSTTSLWINQIAYGTNSKIYFRQNINSGSWTEWKAVAFDGEITAKKVANALTINGKTYDGSTAVDAGVQTVANGGTGATTALGAFESLANGLSEDVNPIDTEHIIFKNTDGTHWGLYTLSTFWEYIKGKISSVLGLTKDSYGGKADTAGTADKTVNVIDYGNTSRTVRIGYEGPGLTADTLLYLAGYTKQDGSSVKIKDVNNDELKKWLGIPRIKYADYQIPSQTFTQFQQVPIELSKFSSEVTPNNVLCFMVIYWTGVQLIASGDWGSADSSGLKCALISLGAGTGSAIIRCVYMV